MNKFIKAIGIFFLIGAFFGLYAGATLAWPGTSLDGLWVINPNGHRELIALGRLMSIPFFLLAATLVVISISWLRKRKIGWYGGVIIFALNILGDIGRLISGDWQAGLFGVVVAGFLLTQILRPSTRKYFSLKTEQV